MDKPAVVRAVRNLMDEFTTTDQDRVCLHWALSTVQVLNEHGVRAVLQAGSASWPMLLPSQDDGVKRTHLSYMFEGSARTYNRARQGLLPEMHCWAALPERAEIVDLTTGFQEQRALELTGQAWQGKPLPDYFWGTAKDLPTGWVYRPDLKAIQICVKLLNDHARKGKA